MFVEKEEGGGGVNFGRSRAVLALSSEGCGGNLRYSRFIVASKFKCVEFVILDTIYDAFF